MLTAARVRAGRWRGLQVAVKTVVFETAEDDGRMALVASEAAVASNLSHRNIVATYSYDLRKVAHDLVVSPQELPVFKCYLIQARLCGCVCCFCCAGGVSAMLESPRELAAFKRYSAWCAPASQRTASAM
jgi:hypothetical protein